MSLDNYRERVRELALKRDGEPIYNGSLDHAGIIVEQMFVSAHDQVSILTGALNARVYGTASVIEKVDIFLAGSDTTVRILVEANEDQITDHPFFERLSKHMGKGDLEVKRVPENWQEFYEYIFLVMDDDSFRFEEDKTKHAAIAAFGDKEGGHHLTEIFDSLWKAGEPVEVKTLSA